MKITTARGKISGQTYDFTQLKEIGAGGEGYIYDVQYNNYEVAKVYKIDKLNSERSNKLELMVANPPDFRKKNGHPTIAFPTDILEYTGKPEPGLTKGQVVGYIMPRLNGHMKKIFNFSDARSRLSNNPLFTYDRLMNAAINFVIAVNTIHKSHYVIGDINESNIMVDEEKTLITIIDTDSFQVTDPKNGQIYRCPVGKPEYTPPELQNKNFVKENRSSHHDLFGMAVILYQLLMENAHPFSGIYEGSGEQPEYSASIKQGFFIHNKKSKSPYRIHPTGLPFEILNHDIQNLFVRCFEDGHANPSARPTAEEWCAVLKRGKKFLTRCPKNSNHYFGNHLSLCPWCERVNRIKFDSFPSKAAVQNVQQVFQKRADQKRANVQTNHKIPRVIPRPVINSFQATATSIKEGESLILSWSVTNAQSVSLSPGFTNLLSNGSITVSPNQNTKYILTAKANNKSITKKIRIKVTPKPEITFETNVDSILLGHSVTLFWDVNSKYSVEINNGIGTVGNNGKITVTPAKYFWGLFGIRNKRNIVYRLTAVNGEKRIQRNLKIAILMPDSPPELVKHISLNPESIPLNFLSISLGGFITLNQAITLIKNCPDLSEHMYLSNHSGLKQISVSLSEIIELMERKASEKRKSISDFYKNLFDKFRTGFFPANINFSGKKMKNKLIK